jgi:hypothetical protein
VPFFPTPTPEDLGSDQGLFLAQLREIAQHGEKDSDRIAAASAGLRAIAHIQTLDQRARRLDQRDRDFQLAERYLDLSERREARMASKPPRSDTLEHAADDEIAPSDESASTPSETTKLDWHTDLNPVALTLEEFAALQEFLPNLDRKYLRFPRAGGYWRQALREFQAEKAAQAAALAEEAANIPGATDDISPTDDPSPSATGGSPARAASPPAPESPAPSLPLPDSRGGGGRGVGSCRAVSATPPPAPAPTAPPNPIDNNPIPTPRPSPIHHSGP